MTIAFIRGYPNGARGLQEISRAPEVEEKAHRFIAYGGQYLVQILTDGNVRAIAIFPDKDGEMREVAAEVSGNGFALLAAVDRLVKRSVLIAPAKMPPRLLVPAGMA